MDKLKNLDELLVHQLRDLYSAEQQLLKALPKMEQKVSRKVLKDAMSEHLEETKNQVKRLEQIFKKLGKDPGGETCKGMQGLIKEAEDMMEHEADKHVMDAALIADAQRVEHYEIAGYGTACTFAHQLGHTEIYNLLQETLREEKNADQKLSHIAEEKVNVSAEA